LRRSRHIFVCDVFSEAVGRGKLQVFERNTKVELEQRTDQVFMHHFFPSFFFFFFDNSPGCTSRPFADCR
jgi:hypothetical protein